MNNFPSPTSIKQVFCRVRGWRPKERDPLWRREMHERWRRPITLVFLALYTVGLCRLGYSLYASFIPNGSVELQKEARGIGHRLFIDILGTQLAVWIPLGLVLACPALAAERQRRSLTEFLLAGLTPAEIVRAKFASIATFILVLCAVPLPLLALCFPLGGVEPLELLGAAVLIPSVAIACASHGLLISAENSRAITAIQRGLFMGIVSLLASSPFVLLLLNIPYWVWFAVAVFLAAYTAKVLQNCQQILERFALNLEQDEQIHPILLPAVAITDAETQPRIIVPRNAVEAFLLYTPFWDEGIEKLARPNAVAWREVRSGIRASLLRTAPSADVPPVQISPWLWALIGVAGACLFRISDYRGLWYIALSLLTVGALAAAVLNSSASFTRERSQGMIAQLKMCPLSPEEVVAGKIIATLLLVARSWGGPSLALVIAGCSQGVLVTLAAALFVALSVTLATCLATTLSLICRQTSVAVAGSFAALLTSFVLPSLATSRLLLFIPSLKELFHVPVLAPWWVTPLHLVAGMVTSASASSPPIIGAFLHLSCSLGVTSGLLCLLAVALWTRTRSQ